MTGVLVALQPIDCESRRDTYFLQYVDASDRVFDRAVEIYSTKELFRHKRSSTISENSPNIHRTHL